VSPFFLTASIYFINTRIYPNHLEVQAQVAIKTAKLQFIPIGKEKPPPTEFFSLLD